MSFFYDLNKKLDGIRQQPEVTHKQLNERDEGKPGKNFAKIAADAAERYGSKAAGERVAGAVRNKLKAQGKLEEGDMDESAFQAAIGKKKYGEEGMKALQKAGRDHASDKTMSNIRDKYDKYDEGVMDTVKSVGKKVASGVNKLVGHGSDEEMLKDLQRRAGAPVTGKKPTFADKIANAKKEVDEMLGDVAAEAIKTALSPKQKKIDLNKNGKLDANDFAMLRKGAKPEMDEDNAFDYKSPKKDAPKVGSVERGHKHDIKHTATGRIVTRRVDDQGNSVGADDDSAASGEKRGRGRPKGTKASIGAKGPSGRSKLMTKEGDMDPADQGEYDQEGEMAKDDIKTIVRHAQALEKILGDNDNLPEWVQAKLAKIEGMMTAVDDYMQNQEDDSEEPIAEKAVSKQQQKFMGMAHAMQKGEKIPGASKELKKVAKTMKKKDVEDFASTKHKGLPDKVKSKKKEESVEESGTTAGSVAPSTATTGSKGGVFGKGIYDSMNFELEQMIAESMSINMSDSTDGTKSLTVTATDDDAMQLAGILKSAGISGQGGDMHSHGEEACPTCGMEDCGCGDVQEAVDENAPDWPTNTETSNDALQYAGGLNKPKTDVAGDGQTTIPNTAVHTQDEDALRRMMEMAGIAQAELEPWKETMKEEAEEEEEVEEDFLESIQRMREIAGIQEAKKPDFLDMDKDGDKEEPMTKAIKDKEEKKVEESIFALTNQWKAYRG